MSTTYRHPTNFLSNMEKKDKPALLKAAEVTNTKVYVKDKAYDYYGRKLSDCISVYSSDDSQNCTLMWQKFNDYKAGRF